MAITALATIKSWFIKGAKPTETQFSDSWDSFWHKLESIPTTAIALWQTVTGANYTMNRQINEDGSFCLTIKYNCASGYIYSIDLLPIAPAQVFFTEFLDVKLDNNINDGQIIIDRFGIETSSSSNTPLAYTFQGNARGQHQAYLNSEYFNDESYDSVRKKLIDLTTKKVTLFITVSGSNPTIAQRKLTIKGYYVKN